MGIGPRWSAIQQTDGRLIVSGSLKLVICEASAVLRAWGKGGGLLNPKPGAVLSLGESESRGSKKKNLLTKRKARGRKRVCDDDDDGGEHLVARVTLDE